ncbi:MAG: AAA family ATPase, partial [Spirochaetaceae bacterium]|nr:AAA family ATPase [Spirochaetaceae bacterium]
MRPRSLDEVIGQDHIVGQGRLLRRSIQADRLSSVIFYGPPGTGKTSLARVIANTTKAYFESLNAVLTGIKDIREAIDKADERRRLYGRRTILFVDEVHRWNKAQQDALLPWVENGTVILIGATTENPFFEVNRALVSRSRIFQLKALDDKALYQVAEATLQDKERGYGRWKVEFEEGALEHLVEVASGDARSLLNALELAVETSEWEDNPPPNLPRKGGGTTGNNNSPPLAGGAGGGVGWPPTDGTTIYISLKAAEESIQRRAVLYDRDGDYHFDTISAFIKSVRGSDPDAALYWLAKMVRAGEDPAFIFRRMIILASEDVGLADPHALEVVIACAQSFDRIGFPEGNFPLAHACLYLATAPKSNSALAFFDALAEVDKEDAEVPNHLRDGSRDAEGFGHGEGYVYPHAYRDHWAAQQYLPTALKGKTFYTPSIVGYEGKIREEFFRKRELQAAVVLGDDTGAGAYVGAGLKPAPTYADGEILTWSASSKGKEGWFKRLESGRSSLLLQDRDAIINAAPPERHSRVLLPMCNDGLLLWECLRKCPEGLIAGTVDSEDAKDALLRLAQVLDVIDQPEIQVVGVGFKPTPTTATTAFSTDAFDRIYLREPWRHSKNPPEDMVAFAKEALGMLAPDGALVLLQSPPALGMRLSRILIEENLCSASLASSLEEAEKEFFAGDADPRLGWGKEALEAAFSGFSLSITEMAQSEERLLREKDLAGWFDKEKSPWGAAISAKLGDKAFNTVQNALQDRVKEGPITWRWTSLLFRAKLFTFKFQ